jgi:hypothetical protein
LDEGADLDFQGPDEDKDEDEGADAGADVDFQGPGGC